MTAALAVIEALLTAVPRIVELIRQGRKLSQINLAEVISTDAQAKLERSLSNAQDFINNG